MDFIWSSTKKNNYITLLRFFFQISCITLKFWLQDESICGKNGLLGFGFNFECWSQFRSNQNCCILLGSSSRSSRSFSRRSDWSWGKTFFPSQRTRTNSTEEELWSGPRLRRFILGIDTRVPRQLPLPSIKCCILQWELLLPHPRRPTGRLALKLEWDSSPRYPGLSDVRSTNWATPPT